MLLLLFPENYVEHKISAETPSATPDRNPMRCPSVVPTAKNSETILSLSVAPGIVAPLRPPIKGKSLRDSWVPPRARNLKTIVVVLLNRILYTKLRETSESFQGTYAVAGNLCEESSDYRGLSGSFPKRSLPVRVFFLIWKIRWYF